MLHGRRPTLDLRGAFVALKEFRAGEKVFQRGDRIPSMRELGFDDGATERMWDAMYVDSVPEDGKTELRAQPPPAPAKTPGKRAPRAGERA